MKFVDRENELRILQRCLGRKTAIIYGRRRVGKTALVRKVLEKSRGIYYQAVKLPAPLLYRELAIVIGKAIKDDALSSGQINDPVLIFRLFASKAPGWTLVLDEFGYMIEVDPSLPSILQRFIDENRGKVVVFLTGSTYSIIQSLLADRSPLWGRVDFSIEVKPLEFLYTKEYWQNLDFQYRAGLYAALGGIPYNWERVVLGKDLFSTLYLSFFTPESPLYQEVFHILREELREPKNYVALLQAIAGGRRRFNEIADFSSISPSSVMKYLEVLKEMRLVEQKVPVGIKEGRKRGLWRISDPMINFWFRFVFPHRHLIEFGAGKGALPGLKTGWDIYMGEVYENIALQLVRKLIAEEKLPPVERLGRWWGKNIKGQNMELDIVGIRNKRVNIVGEVKWGYFTRQDWKALVDKVSMLPLEKEDDLKFVIFSGKGFKFKIPEGVVAIKGEI